MKTNTTKTNPVGRPPFEEEQERSHSFTISCYPSEKQLVIKHFGSPTLAFKALAKSLRAKGKLTNSVVVEIEK